MNRPLWLALAGAAFLAGCGDTKSAGGTGSDFPQPMAKLLDTNLQPVAARVWRLWRVQGDSAEAVHQYMDSNGSGFLVPTTGLWVVEAWSDSVNSGSLDGLSKSMFTDTGNSCSRLLTYLPGQGKLQVGVLPCSEFYLTAPSLHSRPANKPLGVGMFGSADSIRTVVAVPGGSAAYRFMLWSIRWDTVKPPATTTGTGTDSVLITYRGERTSSLRGVVDIGVPHGDWYMEGWTASLSDSGLYDWTYPPMTRWVDSSALRTCFENATGDCTPHRIGPTIWHKEADAHFVVRVQ